MIRGLLKAIVVTVVALVLLYFAFFVTLGRRTLFEHLSRIASTDEAQELGEDVVDAVDRLRVPSDAGTDAQ
jgi:hypothetical protein